MRVLAFVSGNTGTGTSTLAALMASHAARSVAGRAALVVVGDGGDGDDGGAGAVAAPPAASGLDIIAVAPDAMDETLARLGDAGVQTAIVDVGTVDAAAIQLGIASADLVVIPVLPSGRDLAGVATTVAAVGAAGKRFLFVPNRVGPRGLSPGSVMALTQHGQVSPVAVPRLADLAERLAGSAAPDAAADTARLACLWTFLAEQLDREPVAPTAPRPRASAAAQRRRHPRWPTKWQATLTCGDERAIGRLQNISGGGALVLTQAPLAVGATLRMEVAPLGTFQASIVHRNQDLCGLAFDLDDDRRADLAERLEAMFTAATATAAQDRITATAAQDRITETAAQDRAGAEAGIAVPLEAGAAAPTEATARHVAVDPARVGRGVDAAASPARRLGRPLHGRDGTIITVANPKGGSGKSTIAMHLVIALLRAGRRVATADLDPGQWTFSRFLENRRAYAASQGLELPQPVEHEAFHAGIDEPALTRLRRLKTVADVVVIDTAGSITPLTRVAHALADILITPINDSFVDLDVLASLDPETLAFQAVSRYGDHIRQARAGKADAGLGDIDWIVLRNRLTNLDARNKRDMAAAVDGLAERLGFRVGPGLSERTIYRELFLHGLTLSDLQATATPLSLSHVAARQELRGLLATVLPERAAAESLAASA